MLYIANPIFTSGVARRVLCVTGERGHRCEQNYPPAAPLFGDAGTAVLLEGVDRERDDSAGLIYCRLYCPVDTCCSEQGHAFVSLDDANTIARFELSGTATLEDTRTIPLRCLHRGGMMQQSLAAPNSKEPLVFGNWRSGERRETDSSPWVPAYCCTLDAHEQLALVVATLEISESSFEPHRLVDPFVCAIPSRAPETAR